MVITLAVKEVSRTLNCLGGELRRVTFRDLRQSVGGQGGIYRNGLSQDRGGDILGQVNQNRAGSASGGDLKSLVDSLGELGDVFHHNVPFRTWSRDTNNIGLLESVGSNGGSDNLTSKDNQWHTVHQGILHGRDDIGGTRSRSNQDDTGLTSALA